MCIRHAIRVNVNKASKQAKRGQCLPCERLVQSKRHVGKKALLARHLIALLRSQKVIWIFSIFTSSKLQVWSPGMKSIKNIWNITLGFGRNKITSNEPWNTETHKTDRNPPITNHTQWPLEPVKENFRFLRGPLRWLASDIFLTRGSKNINHRKTVLIACFLRGHLNLGCFLYFMPIFLSLFCDWSILLGRVDNPMRDDLDIVWSEIFRSSCGKRFG